MIDPGSGTGTLLASADGEAIVGSARATPSVRSVGASMGVADGLTLGLGEGEGLASALGFSSSSALPTSLEVVKPTSFNAAKTDAPRTVMPVPPLEAKLLSAATPGVPKRAM